MFSYISPEERVPADHPLRRVKAFTDEVLRELSGTFDGMYSKVGRPSIPPERLLKSMVLIALYSVRSDRLFCELLNYNLLYRWFLDMSMDEPTFVPTVFTKNRERLLEHDVARQFFDRVVARARREDLMSDEHFTVDGTLIEAWASMKSFKAKNRKEKVEPPDDPGNPTVDFRGEKRSNDTHESTTDPEARLARKGPGKESKLAYAANFMMENANGLCVDVRVDMATGTSERDAAARMIWRQRRRGIRPKSLGADRGYHVSSFVTVLRNLDIRPHIALRSDRRTPGLDGRTTRHASYRTSQRIRKRIEEMIGWNKTVAGLRKCRFIGLARNRLAAFMVAASYDLLRMARLCPG